MFIDAHLHTARLKGLPRNAAGRISADAFENISWRNANRLLKLGLYPPGETCCGPDQP